MFSLFAATWVIAAVIPLEFTPMNISDIDKSLLLAAFFRGNTHEQDRWTSCADQVVTLSLFYADEITAGECDLDSLNAAMWVGYATTTAT